ncbi:hypothetical protein LYZ86_22730, partial [Xanthomonas hortorum pv. cynarae]|uniref:hypothetical protein n=1 Tax=Xanthomonas hortorum TaxID=56454 RepID=UPI001F20E5BE
LCKRGKQCHFLDAVHVRPKVGGGGRVAACRCALRDPRNDWRSHALRTCAQHCSNGNGELTPLAVLDTCLRT